MRRKLKTFFFGWERDAKWTGNFLLQEHKIKNESSVFFLLHHWNVGEPQNIKIVISLCNKNDSFSGNLKDVFICR